MKSVTYEVKYKSFNGKQFGCQPRSQLVFSTTFRKKNGHKRPRN